MSISIQCLGVRRRGELSAQHAIFIMGECQLTTSEWYDLLVDPSSDEGRGVVVDLLGLEPVSDLTVGRFDRVRSVADVAASLRNMHLEKIS